MNFVFTDIIRKDKKPLGNLPDITVSGENRTKESNILIYNRVPKCGSTTMTAILKKLSFKNKFTLKNGVEHWQ